MAFSVLSQVLAKFIYVYEVKYSYKYFSTYRINQAEIEACGYTVKAHWQKCLTYMKLWLEKYFLHNSKIYKLFRHNLKTYADSI